MTPQPPKVLCIDDEPNLLLASRRVLAEEFDVQIAIGGDAGLEIARQRGPFAVVICDMRMPGLSGADVLEIIRQISPDTTRILLTGETDLKGAIAAVNRGQIFRFLAKPCPADQLMSAVEEAVQLYRLRIAERELLEGTLSGSVQMMIDVLSLASPVAFSRARAVARCVVHMARRQGVSNPWQFQVAALLAPIGCIALDPDLASRGLSGRGMTAPEARQFAQHPEIGHRLIAHIPRLAAVAEMVRHQRTPSTLDGGAVMTRLGAQMIAVAQDLDRHLASGLALDEAIDELRKSRAGHPEELLGLLADYAAYDGQTVQRKVTVAQLRPGMYLEEDVRGKGGAIVVPGSRELTPIMLERLVRFHDGHGLVEPIAVRAPPASE